MKHSGCLFLCLRVDPQAVINVHRENRRGWNSCPRGLSGLQPTRTNNASAQSGLRVQRNMTVCARIRHDPNQARLDGAHQAAGRFPAHETQAFNQCRDPGSAWANTGNAYPVSGKWRHLEFATLGNHRTVSSRPATNAIVADSWRCGCARGQAPSLLSEAVHHFLLHRATLRGCYVGSCPLLRP